jgi:hypothetical protein
VNSQDQQYAHLITNNNLFKLSHWNHFLKHIGSSCSYPRGQFWTCSERLKVMSVSARKHRICMKAKSR